MVFVGSLEPYKNIEGLGDAAVVAEQLPEARLVIIGSGSQQFVGQAAAGGLPRPGRASRVARPGAVSETLDDSTVLVLPSWPEGPAG